MLIGSRSDPQHGGFAEENDCVAEAGNKILHNLICLLRFD